MAQGLDQTIVIPDTHPWELGFGFYSPHGGFMCPFFLHVKMPCLPWLLCLWIFHIPPHTSRLWRWPLPIQVKEVLGRRATHLSLSQPRAAPILALSRPPNPVSPRFFQGKEVSS